MTKLEGVAKAEHLPSLDTDELAVLKDDQIVTYNQLKFAVDEEVKLPEVLYHPPKADQEAIEDGTEITYLSAEDLTVPTVRITEMSGRFSTIPEVLAVDQIFVSLRREKPFIGLTEKAMDGSSIVYRAISYQELE